MTRDEAIAILAQQTPQVRLAVVAFAKKVRTKIIRKMCKGAFVQSEFADGVRIMCDGITTQIKEMRQEP